MAYEEEDETWWDLPEEEVPVLDPQPRDEPRQGNDELFTAYMKDGGYREGDTGPLIENEPDPIPGTGPVRADGSNSFDPSAWLDELERKHGVSDTPEDLAEMRRKNPEDLAGYMRALEAQYKQRGSNKPGEGGGVSRVPGPPRNGPQANAAYGGPGEQGVFNGPLQQMGEDPFSKLITQGYADLIENQGTTADSRAMLDRLMGIIERGGRVEEDPSLYAQRFEAARQPIDSMRKAQLSGLRGTLANRGLISEPGMPQGSEIGAVGRMEEDIAPAYATAAQRLAGDMATENSGRLSQALTLATGLSQAQAQSYLNSLEGATDRQKVLSDIALGTLDRNILWNQFLANYGLNRDQALEAITSGRTEQMMTILALFQQYVNASAGGYV